MENQTSEETQEETQTDPEQETQQEETSEETSEETVKKETPEPVNYDEKFKESQKEAIRLKKENDEFRKKPSNLTGEPVSDVDAIVEVQQATKDLSPEEIAELRFRAAVNKSTLSEARKDENFVLWQGAHKTKVEKDQTLPPSTKQSPITKVKSLADMTIEEKEEALIKMGVGKGKTSWAQPRMRDAKK